MAREEAQLYEGCSCTQATTSKNNQRTQFEERLQRGAASVEERPRSCWSSEQGAAGIEREEHPTELVAA